MKVALINPPIEDAYGEMDLSDVKSTSPPLGLLSIASVLREAGVEVKIFDGERTLPANFDVYGFTAMSINVQRAINYSTALRKVGKITIIGGCHASALPETVKDHFDYVVEGPGEEKILEILGLPARSFMDLDNLPYPAFDLVDFGRYRLSAFGTSKAKSVGLVTSRGCYGKCRFCSRSVFGRKLRNHSALYVTRLMDNLRQRYGFTDFLFYDDTFLANERRVKRFCQLNCGKGFSWSACARADGRIFKEKRLLRKCRDAGLQLLEIGIESGSQKVLNSMGKGINKGDVVEAVWAAKEAGIKTKGNFILGYLTDNHRTIAETIKFASILPLDYAQHTFYTPLPGSEDWERAGNYGEWNSDYSACNTFGINFVPKGMTKEDLRSHSKQFYRKFYLRPSRILSLITENPMRLIQGFKAFRKVAL